MPKMEMDHNLLICLLLHGVVWGQCSKEMEVYMRNLARIQLNAMVVKIYQVSQWSNGAHLVVIEFVEGLSQLFTKNIQDIWVLSKQIQRQRNAQKVCSNAQQIMSTQNWKVHACYRIKSGKSKLRRRLWPVLITLKKWRCNVQLQILKLLGQVQLIRNIMNIKMFNFMVSHGK